MSITMQDLINLNASYHHEHRVTESDVEKANHLVQVIESTRTDSTPQVGDIVQYTKQHGYYYPKAHVENLNSEGRLVICEQPMIPFAYLENGRVYTSTSGGAWSSVPTNLDLVGKAQKMFKDWGHRGPCGGGALRVLAMVNVWRYTEGTHEFTTEHFNLFYVTYSETPVGIGYHYIVQRDGCSYTAFRTEPEYLRWLSSVGGIERPAAWPNSKIVWARRVSGI